MQKSQSLLISAISYCCIEYPIITQISLLQSGLILPKNVNTRKERVTGGMLGPTVCPLAPKGCEKIHSLVSYYFLTARGQTLSKFLLSFLAAKVEHHSGVNN